MKAGDAFGVDLGREQRAGRDDRAAQPEGVVDRLFIGEKIRRK